MNHSEFIDAIIKYEAGDASTKEILDLFSYLIRTGTAWGLQGSYGRNAHALMDAGYLDKDGNITPKGNKFIAAMVRE